MLCRSVWRLELIEMGKDGTIPRAHLHRERHRLQAYNRQCLPQRSVDGIAARFVRQQRAAIIRRDQGGQHSHEGGHLQQQHARVLR